MSTDTALALGPACRARPRRARPGAGLPADGVRRRRPGRAGGHRRRLQRPIEIMPLLLAVAVLRWPSWSPLALGLAAAVALRRARPGHVGRAAGQRRRPGRGRPGHRADGLGVHAVARRPGGGDRPGPPSSASSRPRARAVGHRRPDLHPVAERPTAELLPPVDELRHRPAVRPGQRRHRHRRRLPGPTRSRAPITLGVLHRLRRRQAGRPWSGRRGLVARLSHAAGSGRRWAGRAVAGSGTIAGIGFTVSLLIATRAFHGEQLAEAKLGALSAVVVASVADLGGLPGHRPACRRRGGPARCWATPSRCST